jgi:[protein-PII] uridylyltransferase
MQNAPAIDLLTTFKQRLKQTRDELIAMDQRQANIENVVRTTARRTDELLIEAWQAHFGQQSQITMVAVGGYGRNELNIHSDIDLLFLHDFKDSVEASLDAAGVGAFIQFLWDIGLEVGQSVRSVDECLAQANQDITIMTNLLESRFLAGDESRYHRFNEQIRGHSKWTNESFYAAKYAEQDKRHERFDDTTYKLEPNIKKSPGGLRDIQTISWIANKIYGTSDPDSLNSLGLLTEDELELFKASRNTLWSLRNALHILTGRAEDRLLFTHQQDIATRYALKDKPGQLAIEQLMQEYYRAAHDIRRLNEFILQLIDESLGDAKMAQRIELDEVFYIQSGYLGLSDKDTFEKHPEQILHAFNLYQRHHYALKGFSADCARAIREARPLINDDFRKNPRNLKLFLALFKRETGLTHTLRKMHQFGVLGTFLPAFGKIEGQMQHDLFHAYTVDAHTIMVIRNLRRCAVERFQHELPDISDLMQRTDKCYRLYLAALFHDIAKGRGGNHDILGAEDARDYCEQLGLPQADTEMISWLVLNHLKMSTISQREDLSDSDVIQRFAELTGNQECLDNLYLLTVADIRGTSTSTWTAWKGHLLRQLYSATSALFRERATGQLDSDSEVAPKVQIESKRIRTLALLENRIPKDRLDQYWAMLDDEYLLTYAPDTIAWHAEAICQASVLDLPVVEIRYIADIEAGQYLIYTADTDVLLGTVTSIIEQSGQNIVQARIHEANPGFTVLIFTVTSDHTESDLQDLEDLEVYRDRMRNALLQVREHRAPIKKLIPRRLQQFHIEPNIRFAEAQDEQTTTMSITSLDQPGLIHIIATAIAKCHIRLVSAHITTVGEKAEDRFIISQANTKQALNDHQQACLEAALLKALK